MVRTVRRAASLDSASDRRQFMTGTEQIATEQIGMEYLAATHLELADPADDVRGFALVTPYGHRLGAVEDLVIDPHEQRARLLSVVSGGILGLGASERLIPVEAVTKVDDRVHVDRAQIDEDDDARHRGEPGPEAKGSYQPALTESTPFGDVYQRYGVMPFWSFGYVAPYFHRR
jgi:sporulation protein YlmC with PRC-barrel domain